MLGKSYRFVLLSAIALLAGCTTQRETEPFEILTITGNHQAIADCVYQKADSRAPDSAKINELKSIRTIEVSMGDKYSRYFLATFSPVDANRTKVEIRVSFDTRGFVALAKQMVEECTR
jgi:hypothetical protein